MKYKYKDHYSREYNFLVRARFNSVDTAYQFSWENEDLVESEQERHAESWLNLFVKTKSDLINLFKILTNSDNVEYFELLQK